MNSNYTILAERSPSKVEQICAQSLVVMVMLSYRSSICCEIRERNILYFTIGFIFRQRTRSFSLFQIVIKYFLFRERVNKHGDEIDYKDGESEQSQRPKNASLYGMERAFGKLGIVRAFRNPIGFLFSFVLVMFLKFYNQKCG